MHTLAGEREAVQQHSPEQSVTKGTKGTALTSHQCTHSVNEVKADSTEEAGPAIL